MSTMTQSQIAAALSIPAPQVLQLARNKSFPPATSVSGVLVWDSVAFATFQTLWNAAKAHGWKPVPALLPSFSFTTAAAASPGASYRPEGSSDPTLLDL
jgi:hypothetical protein